jgi:hypothetical protein
VTNNTDSDLVFVVTDALATTGSTLPSAGSNTPGVYGIYTNNGHQDRCMPQIQTPTFTGCSLATADNKNPNGQVYVKSGAVLNLWLVFRTLGDSSKFNGQITYKWFSPTDCSQVGSTEVSPPSNAISPNNCAGLDYDLSSGVSVVSGAAGVASLNLIQSDGGSATGSLTDSNTPAVGGAVGADNPADGTSNTGTETGTETGTDTGTDSGASSDGSGTGSAGSDPAGVPVSAADALSN